MTNPARLPRCATYILNPCRRMEYGRKKQIRQGNVSVKVAAYSRRIAIHSYTVCRRFRATCSDLLSHKTANKTIPAVRIPNPTIQFCIRAFVSESDTETTVLQCSPVTALCPTVLPLGFKISARLLWAR